MKKYNLQKNVCHILSVGDKSIEITEKKVNKLVYRFAKKNKITTPVYHQSKCDKAVTPNFIGYRKFIKVMYRLRLIVSFIGGHKFVNPFTTKLTFSLTS